MKRFLQACDMGVSMYGMKKPVKKRHTQQVKTRAGGDIAKSYSRFYKDQLAAMDRIFKGGGR